MEHRESPRLSATKMTLLTYHLNLALKKDFKKLLNWLVSAVLSLALALDIENDGLQEDLAETRIAESYEKKKIQTSIQVKQQEPSERIMKGRKPFRAIMMEVAKRIQHLKSNSSEWDALQKRVCIQRINSVKHRQGNVDRVGTAVKRNIKQAWTLEPAARAKTATEEVLDYKIANP